jgi:phosphopantetheinyl transferase
MLFESYISEGSKLGIWKIDESVEELCAILSNKSIKEDRFAAITNESRQKEWLAVRVLLKTLCSEEKTIIYTETGKPLLDDKSYNISISHTKNFVAVLIDTRKQVGIDIEYRSDRAFKLKERFMSNEELATLPPGNAVEKSLIYWSAKETMIKMLDKKDVILIEDLLIEPFKLTKEGNLTGKSPGYTFYINYKLTDLFVLTWCLE